MLGLASPRRLRELGIVGMNRRNVVYIAENNPRHLYPLVDDKLKTKLAVEGHNITVPRLLGVCRVQRHIKELPEFLAGKNVLLVCLWHNYHKEKVHSVISCCCWELLPRQHHSFDNFML